MLTVYNYIRSLTKLWYYLQLKPKLQEQHSVQDQFMCLNNGNPIRHTCLNPLLFLYSFLHQTMLNT